MFVIIVLGLPGFAFKGSRALLTGWTDGAIATNIPASSPHFHCAIRDAVSPEAVIFGERCSVCLPPPLDCWSAGSPGLRAREATWLPAGLGIRNTFLPPHLVP